MPNSLVIPFSEQKDAAFTPYSISKNEWHLPIGGIKKSDGAYYYIVKGLRHEHAATARAKGGEYSLSIVFNIGKMAFKPYEDIEVEFRRLGGKDADYSAIARDYRKYLLDSGACRPISERLSPELAYACDAPELRIRLAWKPAPPKIEEQTVENEPEVIVKMTFGEVEDFISGLKAAGVEKAQICLVGWNVSGHDGRWPTAFPVEPRLGGEEGLKKLVKFARSQGYQIVCHTNSTDIYSISEDWNSGGPVAKKPDGLAPKEHVLERRAHVQPLPEKGMGVRAARPPENRGARIQGAALHRRDFDDSAARVRRPRPPVHARRGRSLHEQNHGACALALRRRGVGRAGVFRGGKRGLRTVHTFRASRKKEPADGREARPPLADCV